MVLEYDFPKLVKNFFGVDISKHMIYAYDLADVLGVSPILINTMFKEHIWGKPHFIPGALGVLKDCTAFYEIVIFSNRIKYMSEIELSKWLIDNQILFNGIDVEGSGEYEVHIDDSPAKLAATKSKFKLLFNQPWNENCHNINKNLKRVYTWSDIRKEIL